MSCNKKHIPEPGRGFILCDCGEEMQVKPVEGCYKLHETPWLDEYPDNIPTAPPSSGGDSPIVGGTATAADISELNREAETIIKQHQDERRLTWQ